MRVKIVFIWMICLCGQASAQEGKEADVKINQIVDPAEQKFAELTSRIKPYTDPNSKFKIMLEALEKAPETRQAFLERIPSIISGVSKKNYLFADAFKQIEDHLENINKPLTEEESRNIISKIKLSNVDRIIFASICWERGHKAYSFDVAFNAKDKQRFGNYADELKQCVIDAEKCPFVSDNKVLFNAMALRNLWPAYVNYYMCYDKYSYKGRSHINPYLIFGMMTIFGEKTMREWVEDLDRRKRWLDNPFIQANYMFRQGKYEEAIAYLEDGKEMGSTLYASFCLHSGNFEKLIHLIQNEDIIGKSPPHIDHYTQAFVAQQFGDDELYRKEAKLLFETVLDGKDSYRVSQQIQKFLSLSDMQGALRTAHKYNACEDVFKLLCLSYKYDMAHHYVQLGKLLDPQGIKPAEDLAKEFFTNINHPHALNYDPEWKPRSYKRDYISPAEELKKAMKEGGKLDDGILAEFQHSPEDAALELAIVEYLLNNHFSGGHSERKLMEKHRKYDFLKDYYFKKWEGKNDGYSNLFYAGYYAKMSGDNQLGDEWMNAATILSSASPSYALAVVNAMKSVSKIEPSVPKIDALRRIITRSGPSRQSYDVAFEQEDYVIAARTWTADHLATLYDGNSYGKHWWAWHNNAHDDEALGFLAIKEGNLDKAYEHLEKVWLVSENRYQLPKNLYLAYLKASNKEKAQSIYDYRWNRMEKIYQQTPNYYWALSHLVRWSLECRNPMNGEAVKYAEKLYEMRGDRYFETRLLAEHYVLNKQPEKARELLKVWTERRPRDAELSKFLETLELPNRTLRDDGMYFGSQAWF